MKNKNLKQSLFQSQWLMLLLITILISVFTAIANPRFLAINNIMNIFEQIAVSGLVAAGATILIISGNFDISVGAIIGLACCTNALLINQGVNGFVASVAAIAVCMVCGLLNGALAILFKAPSFIITLATTSVYKGIGLFATKGVIQTVYGKFDTLAFTKIGGVIPLSFVISLLGFVVVFIILNYTQIGRRIYAIGSNEKSAFLSGVRITENKLLFFMLNGFFVGIASVLLLSRVGSALPLIGGAPISGGQGSAVGTFFGVLLLGLISNVLNILGVNPYLQEIASGVIIILSLGISALRFKVLSR